MRPGVHIGQEIGGYRIEAELGRGGMGVVYLAEQVRLGRRVALKLIAPELAQDADFRARFERESRLAASIEHPNVVPVHEAGEAAGTLFISMRYVDGTDLRAVIRREGPLDPRRATGILGQVADALDAAHAAGLVHRDVKPANVLIAAGAREHAYLTDFGLTKHASSHGGLTRTGEWVGTLDYVAPEQIEGRPVDARTDVYALACVLHQCLTGQVPYVRDSDVAKMYAHLHEPPPSACALAPALPAAADEVVARGMAKDPAERYPSAGDLGRAALAAVTGAAAPAAERSVARGAAAAGTEPGATVPAQPGSETGPTVPAEDAPAAAAAAAAGPAIAPGTRWPVRRRKAAAAASTARPAPPTDAFVTAGRAEPPRGRSGLAGALAAVAAMALVAVAVAVPLATGVLGGDEELPSAERAPSGEPARTADQPSRTEGERAPRDPELAVYRTDAYRARYPADWRVVEDDVLKTTFSRTRFESRDGSLSVSIDRSPGEATPPAQKAAEVERAVSASTPGYRRIGFEEVTIGGRPGFEWTFEQDGERKIDLFLNRGGDGYAVFGEGSDFEAVLPVARRIARSIEPARSR